MIELLPRYDIDPVNIRALLVPCFSPLGLKGCEGNAVCVITGSVVHGSGAQHKRARVPKAVHPPNAKALIFTCILLILSGKVY